ncbi:MAG: hypothetical protein BWZ06_01598 [Bacteroidetes bacterium ADurb.BinA261]|nr:MAG: hypothetical protein BWZ06_01598 [Bacteroidetes bacterium ADurb.BinA261]
MATAGVLISEPMPRINTDDVNRVSRSTMMKFGIVAEKSFMSTIWRRSIVLAFIEVAATGTAQVLLGSLKLETTILSRVY